MRLPLRNHQWQFVETLENRRFFCGTAASTVAPALEPTVKTAETSEKVAPAILGPSAVEGTYKGVASGNDGASYEIKLVITPTSAKLTVEGLGEYTSSLTTKQFKLIREEGLFTVDYKGIHGAAGSVSLTGAVKDSGLRITGTYANSAGQTGTFSLKV
jgi:hypothetical protein